MTSGKTVYETGNEPEYYVSDIARIEALPGGMIRLYLASERQCCLRVEYTVVIRKERLAELGRVCMSIAVDPLGISPLWDQQEVAH